MSRPFFSIIVVSLNPGEKLFETLESVRIQSCTDYEVVVKDGGSKDGSVQELQRRKEQALNEQDVKYQAELAEFYNRVRIVERPDKSIYEGMNQAIEESVGDCLYFLDCGDYFYDEQVLLKVKNRLEKDGVKDNTILYGDIYDALQESRVASNPHMDGFGCYRNVPCHQACFYTKDLFAGRGV